MCLCYAWLNGRGYRRVKAQSLNILNNFQNQGEKRLTLHFILAVWQNARLPGWAVGFSQWAGAFLPYIICSGPCQEHCVFLFWLPALPVALCFVAPSFIQLCPLQYPKCSPLLWDLECDEHPKGYQGYLGKMEAFRGGIRSWQSPKGR